jgi:hypothetical protein
MHLERIGLPQMNPRWSTVRVRTFSARRIDQQWCLQPQCGSQVPEPHDTRPCVSLVPTTYTTVELLRVTRLKRESSTSPYISIPVVMRDQLQGSRKSDWYQLAATLVYVTPFGLPSTVPLDRSPHPYFLSSLRDAHQVGPLVPSPP